MDLSQAKARAGLVYACVYEMSKGKMRTLATRFRKLAPDRARCEGVLGLLYYLLVRHSGHGWAALGPGEKMKPGSWPTTPPGHRLHHARAPSPLPLRYHSLSESFNTRYTTASELLYTRVGFTALNRVRQCFVPTIKCCYEHVLHSLDGDSPMICILVKGDRKGTQPGARIRR